MKPKKRLGVCKQCGDKGLVSKRRLCDVCGINNQLEQRKQLKKGEGEHYDKWKAGLAKRLSES